VRGVGRHREGGSGRSDAAAAIWPCDAHVQRAASLFSESGKRLGHIDARQLVPRIW
jgi:hypothetical protein